MLNELTKNYLKDITVQITEKCNFNCPYCFASSQRTKKELSIDDFMNIANFMVENKIFFMKITGGEPFLHKNVYEIINYVEKIHKTVFTNFSTVIDFHKIKNPRNLCFVVNYENRSPTYKKIQDENISNASKKGVQIVLGKNIYSKDFNLKNIVEISQKHCLKKIRLGIANKEINGKNIYISKDMYKDVCSEIVKQIKIYGKNIDFFIDCPIPFCYLCEEDRNFLIENAELKGVCNSRIIFDVDLHISHCYVTSCIENKSMSFYEYKKLEDIRKKALDNYNSVRNKIKIPQKCKECIFYKNNKCTHGCFSTVYDE